MSTTYDMILLYGFRVPDEIVTREKGRGMEEWVQECSRGIQPLLRAARTPLEVHGDFDRGDVYVGFVLKRVEDITRSGVVGLKVAEVFENLDRDGPRMCLEHPLRAARGSTTYYLGSMLQDFAGAAGMLGEHAGIYVIGVVG